MVLMEVILGITAMPSAGLHQADRNRRRREAFREYAQSPVRGGLPDVPDASKGNADEKEQPWPQFLKTPIPTRGLSVLPDLKAVVRLRDA
jgi:hypothetical protein